MFVLLDWASYIRPLDGLNITPWNPQPALAIALLLSDQRRWWLVWAGLLTADLVVRGAPVSWVGSLAATAVLALAYAAIARVLAIRLGRRVAFFSLNDLLWFTLISIVGALFSGVMYVTALIAAGQGPRGSIYEAFARYWVGEGVGLLVTLPILLMAIDPVRRTALIECVKSRHGWAIASLSILLIYVVFNQDLETHFRFFYLLLLPVIWAAARFGAAGAVLSAGLIQGGLIVAVGMVRHADVTVFELQLLMAAITMTGLMLGVTIDERARVSSELRSSLHLAAAGQMAAAIAHELGQPLTALSSYARACQLLVEHPGGIGPAQVERLAEVAEKIVADTKRANEVIRRLRDFFRSGSTQLQPVFPATILRQAVEAQRDGAEAMGVQIDQWIEDSLPATPMDPVQIGVVLRNLISNAVDAARSAGGKGQVIVDARYERGALRVDVRDDGPGVAATRLPSLFDAGPSDKPGGMGLGLSICRAIVEAHGGRLWAEAGPGGRFCFTLPSAGTAPARSAHAS